MPRPAGVGLGQTSSWPAAGHCCQPRGSTGYPTAQRTCRRKESPMASLMVDFITSLDGYGAAEGWPGYWGRQVSTFDGPPPAARLTSPQGARRTARRRRLSRPQPGRGSARRVARVARAQDGVHPVAGLQLGQDVRDVVGHRLGADLQLGGDLAGCPGPRPSATGPRPPARSAPGNAGGAAAVRSSAASIRPATAAPNTAPPAATARIAASSSSWPAPFEHVAPGAGAHRGEHRLVVVQHRQHQDDGLRAAPARSAGSPPAPTSPAGSGPSGRRRAG